jgi:hypothetical protein
MKPLPVSKQNDKVQTFGINAEVRGLTVVHISARASAADDLRNLERVRRIMAWEGERKINIYPPPEFRFGMFVHVDVSQG